MAFILLFWGTSVKQRAVCGKEVSQRESETAQMPAWDWVLLNTEVKELQIM